MDMHRKEFAEKLYHLHTSGGGSLNWREVGAQAGISWQSARGKVRRWLKKQEQETDEAIIASYPDDWPPSITSVYRTPPDRTVVKYITPPPLYTTPPGYSETLAEIEARVKHTEEMLEKLIGKQEMGDAESDDSPF